MGRTKSKMPGNPKVLLAVEVSLSREALATLIECAIRHGAISLSDLVMGEAVQERALELYRDVLIQQFEQGLREEGMI